MNRRSHELLHAVYATPPSVLSTDAVNFKLIYGAPYKIGKTARSSSASHESLRLSLRLANVAIMVQLTAGSSCASHDSLPLSLRLANVAIMLHHI